MMLADYDLVIFDCDGVLVDSERLAVQAFVQVLQDFGVGASVDMVERCFGMKQSDILLRVAEQTGQDIPLECAEHIWPVTRQYFERGLQPMPGVAAFLDRLTDTKRCVASSSNPERIELSLSLTGLAAYFSEAVYSSHQVARGKPAPDLFLFAAASMAVEPRRCLVIEDSIYGIQGAVAAGMTAIGFSGGSHIPDGHEDELKAGGAVAVDASWEALGRRLLG